MPPESQLSSDPYREDATPARVINPSSIPPAAPVVSAPENPTNVSTPIPEPLAAPLPTTPSVALPKEEIATNYIEQATHANESVAGALSMADLANKNSPVYKAPEVEKAPRELPPEKPKFDEEGLAELVTLRTYHNDVAEAVKGGSLSMIKVAAREQGRKRTGGLEQEKKPASMAHLLLIFGASLLFVAGMSAVVFAWITKSQPVAITAPTTSSDIISTEGTQAIDITGLSSRDIENTISKYVVPGTGNTDTLEKLSLSALQNNTPTNLTSGQVLQAIGANVPTTLSQSLSPQNFMLGVWTGNNRAEPFLILTTTSDQTAFPGMLEWEGNLAFDMEPLMGPQSIASGNVFTDKIIQNHDARALVNGSNMIFFYTVVNNNIIIIAKSSDALGLILERLREASLL